MDLLFIKYINYIICWFWFIFIILVGLLSILNKLYGNIFVYLFLEVYENFGFLIGDMGGWNILVFYYLFVIIKLICSFMKWNLVDL